MLAVRSNPSEEIKGASKDIAEESRNCYSWPRFPLKNSWNSPLSHFSQLVLPMLFSKARYHCYWGLGWWGFFKHYFIFRKCEITSNSKSELNICCPRLYSGRAWNRTQALHVALSSADNTTTGFGGGFFPTFIQFPSLITETCLLGNGRLWVRAQFGFCSRLLHSAGTARSRDLALLSNTRLCNRIKEPSAAQTKTAL